MGVGEIKWYFLASFSRPRGCEAVYRIRQNLFPISNHRVRFLNDCIAMPETDTFFVSRSDSVKIVLWRPPPSQKKESKLAFIDIKYVTTTTSFYLSNEADKIHVCVIKGITNTRGAFLLLSAYLLQTSPFNMGLNHNMLTIMVSRGTLRMQP